jgi:predicted neuraminidase
MKRTISRILVALALLAAAVHRLAAEPGVLKSEFIFESAPFPSCHASTIAETRDGLVAAWFGGTRERHPDVGIWVSRWEGGRWTPPVEVANGVGFATNRFPTWNPVLFQPRTGPSLLFYKVGPSPGTWWGMLKTSADGGKTWSAPQRLPEGILGPIKNKPVQLASGDLLCPSSTENGGWRVHFELTSDLGRTWRATPPVNDGKAIGAIQPSILFHPATNSTPRAAAPLEAGRRNDPPAAEQTTLQALGRTKQDRIFEIWSNDGGRTWGDMRLTDLPNPNSGTDAVTLRDGRQLLVYNHNSAVKGRNPLNVALSPDGRTWFAAAVLENDPAAPNGFAYPAVIQTRDGLVHVTYTWKRLRIKHAVIDPQKLELREIVRGAWPGAAESSPH